MKCYNTNVMQ